MLVSGLGALFVSGDEVEPRDIVVMATKKMRTVPEFHCCHGIDVFLAPKVKTTMSTSSSEETVPSWWCATE